jgi:hypothetical protein
MVGARQPAGLARSLGRPGSMGPIVGVRLWTRGLLQAAPLPTAAVGDVEQWFDNAYVFDSASKETCVLSGTAM